MELRVIDGGLSSEVGQRDTLADNIVKNLVDAKLIEPFDYDPEFMELPLVTAGEIPLGPMLEEEKRPFMYAEYINDLFDEWMRENNAQFGEKFSSVMRDNTISTAELMEKIMAERDTSLSALNVPITRFHTSIQFLRLLWSYSVKQRFNSWERIGVRKNYIIVSYAQPTNVHA